MTVHLKTKVTIPAILLAITGCAMAEPADPRTEEQMLASLDTSRACFTQREIRNFARAPSASAGRERIYLDTGLRETFLLETTGPCAELDFSNRLALETRGLGSVCTGDLENLVFTSRAGGGDGFCPVRVLGRVPER
ncbi:hypothetical protein GRI62_10280 [Erythrobacter arachoides]|uniref:Lipoprotein n=1 Tax=Aurantiacibacter arachoides TaxID=1850444 RepID=A0A845A4Y3_9SPHN|nr:DUF6491 family protein [Aurantiacibacter arachoides]MXO93987.1 hypothetical protein [Aurantiacibacter arachoides]GGD45006.1 hypothetical protein GCM10011411_00800 [Aurantiacibacter arachoides]